jgi:septum formation protein
MKTKKTQLILASSSPRRVALLASCGIAPDKIRPAEIDETSLSKELPRALASRLALAKAKEVAKTNPDAIVLGADTVVACGRRILPKAETAQDVRACLTLLSGRRHHVLTGVALILPEGGILSRLADSSVTFKRLTESEIESYVISGEGIGKAGGYAIQGRAAMLVRAMAGSYSNIVGLPLFDVGQMLKSCGYL